MMWSAQDIRGLMLMSGIIGAMIGAMIVTMGVALYVSFNELKNARSKK